MKKLLCLFGALVLVFASVGFAFADSEPIPIPEYTFFDSSFSPSGYLTDSLHHIQPHVYLNTEYEMVTMSYCPGSYNIHPGDSIVFDLGDVYQAEIDDPDITMNYDNYEDWLFSDHWGTPRFMLMGLHAEDLGSYTIDGTKVTFTFDPDFSQFLDEEEYPETPYAGIYDWGAGFYDYVILPDYYDPETEIYFDSQVELNFADLDGEYIDDEESGERLWLEPELTPGNHVYDFTQCFDSYVEKYIALSEFITEEDGSYYLNSDYSFPETSGSNNVISSTGSVFSTTIGFVSTVVQTITSNPLLLIFAIVSLVGLGVGLTKRIMNL